jgi:ATP-dependent DNA ligase
LLGAPLQERKKVLEKIVKEEQNTLEIAKGILCDNSEQVFE